MLTDDEYEKIYEQAEATVLSNIADGGTSCHWCMNKHEEIGYKKGSKETAEKFAERLEDETGHWNNGWHIRRKAEEICKELVDE